MLNKEILRHTRGSYMTIALIIIEGYFVSLLLAGITRTLYRTGKMDRVIVTFKGGRYGFFSQSGLHNLLRKSVKRTPLWVTGFPALNALYFIWGVFYPLVHLLLWGVGKIRNILK